MPLNPQAAQVLEVMAASGFTLTGEDPQAIRDAMALLPRPEGEAVGSVVGRTVPGPAGEIPVRIYTPAPMSGGTRPVLVWFHGGGWVLGSLDGSDFACRMMTNAAQCVVVSVDYRLAPEAKFPAAADDCFAVTQWVHDHATEIGADAHRIAVGGDSAGGNLAAVVAQMAKAAGGPALSYQVLIYPVTSHDYGTASYRDNAEGYLLTKDSMVWFWDHYLRNADDSNDPKASPLRAADLAGLPPALVVTAEFDPLRDEGEAYAQRLAGAGVPTEYQRLDGQIHGIFWLGGAVGAGRTLLSDVAAALRAAFAA